MNELSKNINRLIPLYITSKSNLKTAHEFIQILQTLKQPNHGFN